MGVRNLTLSGLRLHLAVMTSVALLAASPLKGADPPASPASPASPAWRRHTIDAADRTSGKLGADGVRLADINHDGRLDVATGWEQGGAIRVCLNPGPRLVRKPWPAVTVGRVRSPEDAVFGDLDRDGQFDVISCCEGNTRQIFVHWAPSNRRRQLDPTAWTTGSIPAVAGKQAWMYALPLDIDGRHGMDLLVGSKGKNASVGWLEAPANPRDLSGWTYHRLQDAGWIMSLERHDIDIDGDWDIVVSDRRGPKRGVYWLENPGRVANRKGRRWKRHEIGARGVEVLFLALGDLDRDGRLDIVTAARESRLLLFLGSTNGFTEHSIPLPDEFRYGKGVAIGDIDGDRQPDLVMANRGDPKKRAVSWISYRDSPTSGKWTTTRISDAAGSKFDLVQLVDVDGDGDLDVMSCEEVANLGVFWYENPRK